MKKTVLLTMIALLSLCASANERFHIEDFTVTAGETCTVSILLENEVPYTAFQTDLYLPDGLSVVQEDDEYIFDLTPRNRDHAFEQQRLRGSRFAVRRNLVMSLVGECRLSQRA